LRIREMDEAGIDLQVLSHSIPGLQAVDAEAGPPLARRTNDRLYEVVQRHPDRFSAFAALPTANPRLRPTSWSVPSPGSASRARWSMA